MRYCALNYWYHVEHVVRDGMKLRPNSYAYLIFVCMILIHELDMMICYATQISKVENGQIIRYV